MTEMEQMNKQFRDNKMEYFKSLWQHIYQTIDKLIINIMSLENKWTSNLEGKLNIYQLGPVIDRAAEFLSSTFQQISEIDKNIIENIAEEMRIDKPSIHISAHKNDANMESLSALMKQFQRHEKRLDENEETLQIFSTKLDQVDKIETEMKKMKTELKKCSENQNKMQEEIISKVGKDVNVRFKDLNNEINELQDLVAITKDKNQSKINKLITRSDSLEKDVAGLSKDINKNMEDSRVILKEQNKFAVDEADMTKKLKDVEERNDKIKDLQKQFEDADEKYKMVCHMLASRLKPLEQLQQIINEKSKSRNDNVAELQKLSMKVSIMSPKIDHLGKLISSKIVGFTVIKSCIEQTPKDSVITTYDAILTNVGGYFNDVSGEFKVPRDGTYVVNAIIPCTFNEVLEVRVYCDCESREIEMQKLVSRTFSGHFCDLAVVEMKRGDILFAKVVKQSSTSSLGQYLQLSCLLIR